MTLPGPLALCPSPSSSHHQSRMPSLTPSIAVCALPRLLPSICLCRPSVSTPPTPSATTAARRRVRRLHLRLRLRRLRPALPASSAHLRRDVQLGFRRRLRRRRPRLPPGPGPTALWTGPSSHVGNKGDSCVCMTESTTIRTTVPKVRATHHRNDKRGWGSRR